MVALATVAAIAVLAISGTPPARVLSWPASTIAPAPIARSPMPVPRPPVARHVYIAPMGDFPREKAEALVAHYREKYDLAIEITASIPLPADAFDYQRSQIGAEGLLAALAASDVAAEDPDAVIIGLTRVDMYIEWSTWRYAYALRSEGSHAVVSTARFDAFRADEAKQMQRLRKMVTKNLGFLYYGLGTSEDPGSVMYGQILGPDDLDAVSEDF
jgi:predicted Zn-dependent protease